MRIPDSVIKEAINLLKQDEDQILQRLGSEIYSLERQQPGQTLIKTIPAADLKKKAIDFFKKKRSKLKQAICPEWEKKGRQDFLDTTQSMTLLIQSIALSLNLTTAYISIAMATTVLILKRGINKFCKD